MVAKFFWDQDCNRKIHWVAWSALCKSKEEGGLGFKRLRFQNMALLSKQAWRLAVNPQGLAYQVLRAKYFPSSDFLSAQISSNPSFTWRSIFVAKSTLVQGLRWEVGDGMLINVVGSPWLPRLPTFKLISRLRSLPVSTSVSRLLNANRSWNLDLVRNEFGSLDTKCILQVSTRSAPIRTE
ncbi:UNVERIFIED_CONTAM: putative mitochondrial protein [Sesamum angustifolium]|uniref:Mitochondrial protein n=1 Tax=Sesamum angustifolium TaxID=2727405 RepID=A0AAW2NZC3_9LAMI